MDSMCKEDYDTTLRRDDPIVEVPMSQIPGVLALLQVSSF
jgi:hypothetical protein